MAETTEKHWETVYRRNIGKMIGICYRYTANRQLAEDLAHDAFLKAIDKAGSFQGRGHFEAWLCKIVVNHVLQYLRDEKRKRQADDWLRHEHNHEDIHPPDVPEHSEQELLEAITTLPEHHRLVFNLYVIDNYTHHQIGEALGISTGTSKSHLARARKKLRQLLAEKADKKQDWKRAMLLFLVPKHIDSVYRKYFSHVPIAGPQVIIAWSAATVAASVGIVLTTIVIVPKQISRHTPSPPRQGQAVIPPDTNPARTDSATATF